MTGPQESHKRYRISRQLRELIGEKINVLFCKKRYETYSFTKPYGLEFHEQRGRNNAGFYFTWMKIPVRSVKEINLDGDCPEIVTNLDYLESYREARA